MSFFKDFKEDLSQAVNELMPAEEPKVEEAPVVTPVAAPQEDTLFNSDELADMLKTIDEVKTDVQMTEPAIPVASAAVEVPVATPVAPVAPVVEPVAEPVIPTTVVEPIFAPEPEVAKEEKIAVAPIFGEPDVIKEAPINTAKNLKAMEVGVIIRGMDIIGNIKSEGSLDVQGSVKGNIEIEGRLEVTGSIEGNSVAEEIFADGAKVVGDIKCNGAVKVGPSTVVRGNITATAAVIAGAVKGDIDVQGPVILDSSAIIMGNIKSKSIQINNGATIEGLCSQCYGDISPMSFFGEEKPEKPATKSTKASK